MRHHIIIIAAAAATLCLPSMAQERKDYTVKDGSVVVTRQFPSGDSLRADAPDLLEKGCAGHGYQHHIIAFKDEDLETGGWHRDFLVYDGLPVKVGDLRMYAKYAVDIFWSEGTARVDVRVKMTYTGRDDRIPYKVEPFHCVTEAWPLKDRQPKHFTDTLTREQSEAMLEDMVRQMDRLCQSLKD